MKMKKVLAAVLAGTMVMGSVVAVSAASYTVTNAAWWDAWTPTWEIADGATVELTVDLTTAGTEVYQTLNAAFVNVATDGTTAPADTSSDYYEYVVLRSDAYGWGDYYATTTYTGTDYLYNADVTDYSFMSGATYDITITRSGDTINYDFVITEADGTVLNCGYEIVIADLSGSVYVFFTGDAGVTFTISDADSSSDDNSDDSSDNSDDSDDSSSDDSDDGASNSSDDDSSSDDSSSSNDDENTGTGDAAPIAATVVALLGCAAIVVASKKKMA